MFSEYDPPAGGLRTWPYIRTPSETEGEPDSISHFTNLKQEPNKRYTQATYDAVRPTTLYGDLLSKSRTQGADHSTHAYSTSSFRQRRDAIEVAWGAHKYRIMTKAHKHRFPTCAKCGQKLTHSHLLGGCLTTSKLKISRHHSTFKLLVGKTRTRTPSHKHTGRLNAITRFAGFVQQSENKSSKCLYKHLLIKDYQFYKLYNICRFCSIL